MDFNTSSKTYALPDLKPRLGGARSAATICRAGSNWRNLGSSPNSLVFAWHCRTTTGRLRTGIESGQAHPRLIADEVWHEGNFTSDLPLPRRLRSAEGPIAKKVRQYIAALLRSAAIGPVAVHLA